MSDEEASAVARGGRVGMGHGVHKSLVSLYSVRFHGLGFRLGRGSCPLTLFFFLLFLAWAAAGMHWECSIAECASGSGSGSGPGSVQVRIGSVKYMGG